MHTCVSGVPAALAALPVFSTSDAWVAWANLEGPAPFALAPGLRGVPWGAPPFRDGVRPAALLTTLHVVLPLLAGASASSLRAFLLPDKPCIGVQA